MFTHLTVCFCLFLTRINVLTHSLQFEAHSSDEVCVLTLVLLYGLECSLAWLLNNSRCAS